MTAKEGNYHLIQQITDLLLQFNDHNYTQKLPLLSGSSIGQHVRHILEFYQCLINGCGCEQIDYASRERNLALESAPQSAMNAFRQIQNDLDLMVEADSIQVCADFSSDEAASRPTFPSTIGRELLYAYDHAVHHLAIIKIGIRSYFPDLSVDPNLGVAPSTIKFRAKQR